MDKKGPERTPRVIDREARWDEVAREPGFQYTDQGGYKGSDDDSKFESQHRYFPGSDTVRPADNNQNASLSPREQPAGDKKKKTGRPNLQPSAKRVQALQ